MCSPSSRQLDRPPAGANPIGTIAPRLARGIRFSFAEAPPILRRMERQGHILPAARAPRALPLGLLLLLSRL